MKTVIFTWVATGPQEIFPNRLRLDEMSAAPTLPEVSMDNGFAPFTSTVVEWASRLLRRECLMAKPIFPKVRSIMANQRDQGSRGFGSMDKDKQREIAAKGGRASHGGGSSDSSSGGQRGGSSEQHAKAGRQSHKNS
jgi:general stress protein YciG